MARPKIVLTEQLHLPARKAREVRAACDPRFDLVDKDLRLLRTDLSAVRGGSRTKRMEECIRGALVGTYQVQLLSGHPGSGKSTELRWLEGELRKPKDDVAFHVLFVDVQEYLDVRDVQLPDFVTALFSALLDDPLLGLLIDKSTVAKQTAGKMWKRVVSWLKAIGLTLEAEIPVGEAKVKLGVMKSPGVQKRFRDVSRDHVISLVTELRELLQALRPVMAEHGTDDLVIIADNLERVERLPLDDGSKRTTHDLFFIEQLPLIQDADVHIIVTIPVSLHFTQGRLRQAFSAPSDVVLPMITVRKRGLDVDAPDEAGIAALRGLLEKRIALSVVFADEDAIRHAIMQSGGCLRDLFRIVTTGALNKPTLGLTRADVDDVLREFGSNMERLLQGRGFLRELHHVVRTGSFPDDFDDDLRQWLLYELIVLEYNKDTWYDVHPFARRTRAFQDAGKAKAPA
ncbi:hypothetical protein [Polyangium sorediatum]|uniref:Orc1-like AAA ATPase domain-containing protein n=1 Tax=Polyangium sorediatum TaxID=889274 RepID=A0ABT6NRB3_9BACT|nr:hypothetical protein [Polyangium sorediatum]MDI1430872.1 hypothetical protein [Polyangium sorediatum]